LSEFFDQFAEQEEDRADQDAVSGAAESASADVDTGPRVPRGSTAIARRFRGYLPVVVDVETGGLDPNRAALLEISAVLLDFDADGRLVPVEQVFEHVQPAEGTEVKDEVIAFLGGVSPEHPFRYALPEPEALQAVFAPIRRMIRATGCNRAVLVGHNAWFDLTAVHAAARRAGVKRNPFHPFTSIDTASLGALVYGQTVLAKVLYAADIPWDEREAHSALYDARVTAELFCEMVNLWGRRGGVVRRPRRHTDPARSDLQD